jgi:hypothetical protein
VRPGDPIGIGYDYRLAGTSCREIIREFWSDFLPRMATTNRPRRGLAFIISRRCCNAMGRNATGVTSEELLNGVALAGGFDGGDDAGAQQHQ